MTSAPVSAAIAAAASGVSFSIAAIATRAPSVAKRVAMPRPMPLLPPVTTTVWPSKRFMASSVFRVGRAGLSRRDGPR